MIWRLFKASIIYLLVFIQMVIPGIFCFIVGIFLLGYCITKRIPERDVPIWSVTFAIFLFPLDTAKKYYKGE